MWDLTSIKSVHMWWERTQCSDHGGDISVGAFSPHPGQRSETHLHAVYTSAFIGVTSFLIDRDGFKQTREQVLTKRIKTKNAPRYLDLEWDLSELSGSIFTLELVIREDCVYFFGSSHSYLILSAARFGSRGDRPGR